MTKLILAILALGFCLFVALPVFVIALPGIALLFAVYLLLRYLDKQLDDENKRAAPKHNNKGIR